MKVFPLVSSLLLAAVGAQDSFLDLDDTESEDAPSGSPSVVASSPQRFLSSKDGRSDGAGDGAAVNLESAITDLVMGKRFSATPMGESVSQISKIVSETMLPKVRAAHRSDQMTLKRLNDDIKKCGGTMKSGFAASKRNDRQYRRFSGLHKSCRSSEAIKRSSKLRCVAEERNLKSIKKLKCDLFAAAITNYGTQKSNAQIVKKAGSEATEMYIRRVSSTFCGNHIHGSKGQISRQGGWGGGLPDSILDKYLRAKAACHKAKTDYDSKVKECSNRRKQFFQKKSQCDSMQRNMDSNSCSYSVKVKDVCETYSGCRNDNVKAYIDAEKSIKKQEIDRKAEWRGLKRMSCLVDSFTDGKVADEEINTCKNRTVDTSSLIMKYYAVPRQEKCRIPLLFPSTGPYLRREFAPLPALAKGRVSAECNGMEEISTQPAKGSPRSCKCRQVTLNGPYSAGAMVKCTNCLDVYRSTQRNSCPRGTKIFSPASRSDWRTLIASGVGPLRAPNWIIDITKPTSSKIKYGEHPAMNSENPSQSAWRTQDGSPWWLRSTKYTQPDGNYNANCFLDVKSASNENSVNFDDNNCRFHSKSYYCQAKKHNIKPRRGSPSSCKCTKVNLAGPYSAGALIRCTHCLAVRKTTQKNSCPAGTKIFSPRSKKDWETVMNSGGKLATPHWIVDVTRSSNGCGSGCKKSMNSQNRRAATWHTSDGSPWWLRSNPYSQPSGNYHANCYLLVHDVRNLDAIRFNDENCHYRSSSYYCQPIQRRKKSRKGLLAA
jgi:hypothetical protein